MLVLVLAIGIFGGTPKALAASADMSGWDTASPSQRLEMVHAMAIPITNAPREVVTARAESARYRNLLPRGFRVDPSRAKLFKTPDQTLTVSIPLSASGYSGGAFTFVFKNGVRVSSQQLVIRELSTTSGHVALYNDGTVVMDRVVEESGHPQMRASSSSSFESCYNNLPGWIKDVVALMCAAGCLTAAHPIMMVWCVTCLLGLGGIYASYALKCLNER